MPLGVGWLLSGHCNVPINSLFFILFFLKNKLCAFSKSFVLFISILYEFFCFFIIFDNKSKVKEELIEIISGAESV